MAQWNECSSISALQSSVRADNSSLYSTENSFTEHSSIIQHSPVIAGGSLGHSYFCNEISALVHVLFHGLARLDLDHLCKDKEEM